MANTFELIASSTVGSGGASSIDFTSIPSTYTDLVLKLAGRSTTTDPDRDAVLCSIKFNNTSTTYTSKWLRGNGSTAASFSGGGALIGYTPSSAFTSNTFSNTEVYIPSYTGSQQKSYSVDNVADQNVAAYDSVMGIAAGLWDGTSAINRITLTLGYGNFAQYSTAYLYGVKNA